MSLPPLWRLSIAVAAGVVALLILRGTAPPTPTYLRCSTGPGGVYVKPALLAEMPGPAPDGAWPAARRAELQGSVFAPAGCVDGWLMPTATVAPRAWGTARDGLTAVAVVLDGVRPGDVIDLHLGPLTVVQHARVLQVDGHYVDGNPDGSSVNYRSPSTVEIEVPAGAGEVIGACTRLGRFSAIPSTARDALPAVSGDCATLDHPSTGHTSLHLPLTGVSPQEWYALYDVDRRIAIVRVMAVGDRFLPGTGPSTKEDVVVDVSSSGADALRGCLHLGRILVAQGVPANTTDESVGSCQQGASPSWSKPPSTRRWVSPPSK